MLTHESKIPLYQELVLRAYDNFFYGNYNVAVIEAETAFEVFIDNFIAIKYNSTGKSHAYIEGVLKTGLYNILKYHIRKATSFDFISSQEYKDWNCNAYEKRNQIVHEGIDASAEEANNAITTIVKTINFLNTL